MLSATFVSKGLHKAKHTKLAVDISEKDMHKASREKIREHTDISYDDIFEFIALNFPGMKIAHVKTMDYGDKGFTDGVHNTIQYIQLSKDSGEYVNAVDKTYNYGFENSSELPFD